MSALTLNPPCAWIRCVVVVAFDVDAGQVTEYCQPAGALSEEESKRIAYLSLPDSYNSDQDRDASNLSFTFRTRRDTNVPLLVTTEHVFDYGFVYFRRSRDRSARRGYVQKAIVIVTPAPYTGLFSRVANILGPLYFAYGEAILESAYRNIQSWPRARRGMSFDLPVVGHVLGFRVPWTGDEWDNAQIRSRSSENIPIPPDQRYRRRSAPWKKQHLNATGSEGGGGDDGGDSDIDDVDGARRGSSETSATNNRDVDNSSSNSSNNTISRNSGGTNGVSGSDGMYTSSDNESGMKVSNLTDMFSAQVQQQQGLFQDVGLYSCFGPALTPSLWHLWELVITGQPVMVFAPTPSLCSQTVLGLVSMISPVGFHGDFRPFLTIYDPDFKDISAACAATKSRRNAGKGSSSRLPVLLVGYTNPFFLKALEHWPNLVSHGSSLRIVSEHTTPIKAKTFAAPGASFRGALDAPTSSRLGISSMLSSSSSKSTVKGTPPCLWTRSDAVLPGNRQILRSLMHLPDAEMRRARRLACGIDSGASVESGGSTIGSNLRHTMSASISSMHGASTEESRSRVASTGESNIPPGVAINNAYLRQHFRQLTEQFLRPFDRYFGAAPVTSIQKERTVKAVNGGGTSRHESPKRKSKTDLWRVQIGPYCDPHAVLPKFDEVEFLQTVALRLPQMLLEFNEGNFRSSVTRVGLGLTGNLRTVDSRRMPKSVDKAQQKFHSRWVRIYAGFIRGPHFRAWFSRKTAKHVAEIKEASRSLLLDMPAEALIQQNAPTMYRILNSIASSTREDKRKHAVPRREIMSLVRLWKHINSALNEEEDILVRKAMQGHLESLNEVIPHQFLKREKGQENETDKRRIADDANPNHADVEEMSTTNHPKKDLHTIPENGMEDAIFQKKASSDDKAPVISSDDGSNVVNPSIAVEYQTQVDPSPVTDSTTANRNEGSDLKSKKNHLKPLRVHVNPSPVEAETPSNDGGSVHSIGGMPVPTVTSSPRTLETRRKVAETFDAFWPRDK